MIIINRNKQQSIGMLKFVAFLQPTPKLWTQLTKVAVVSTGLFCGYLKAKYVNSRYDNVNPDKLTQYQTEDQVNTLIQTSNKPAVIYYALPILRDHSLFRQFMFKYSNLYPGNAIWVMVNVNRKFQEVRGALDYKYKTRIMLEVRFPKSETAIKVGEEGEFMEVGGKMHRREGFAYNFNEEGFRKFLEENRVIEGADPVENTLQLTRKALFSNIERQKV